MFSVRVFTMSSLSFATLGLSVAIVNSPQGPASLYQPAGSSLIPSPFNVSTLSTLNITASSDLGSRLNASMLEGQEVICRTPQQLTPPEISSCQDAFAQMPMNPALAMQDPTYTYGPRHVAGLHPDWKLPIRWISCEYSRHVEQAKANTPNSRRKMHHRSHSDGRSDHPREICKSLCSSPHYTFRMRRGRGPTLGWRGIQHGCGREHATCHARIHVQPNHSMSKPASGQTAYFAGLP